MKNVKGKQWLVLGATQYDRLGNKKPISFDSFLNVQRSECGRTSHCNGVFVMSCYGTGFTVQDVIAIVPLALPLSQVYCWEVWG